jgi:hypothetical protein
MQRGTCNAFSLVAAALHRPLKPHCVLQEKAARTLVDTVPQSPLLALVCALLDSGPDQRAGLRAASHLLTAGSATPPALPAALLSAASALQHSVAPGVLVAAVDPLVHCAAALPGLASQVADLLRLYGNQCATYTQLPALHALHRDGGQAADSAHQLSVHGDNVWSGAVTCGDLEGAALGTRDGPGDGTLDLPQVVARHLGTLSERLLQPLHAGSASLWPPAAL